MKNDEYSEQSHLELHQALEKIWLNKVNLKIIERILEGISQVAIAAQCGVPLSSIKKQIAFLSRIFCFNRSILSLMKEDALAVISHQSQGVLNHETK